METIFVHPKNQKELATIEAILKALDVAFHKQEEDPYDRASFNQSGKNKVPGYSGRSLQQDEETWKLE